MSKSDGLQKDINSAPRRNGGDRPGDTSGNEMSGAGDDASSSDQAKKVSARRDAAYGGNGGESAMQQEIGGPYGGRTGNPSTKNDRISALPA